MARLDRQSGYDRGKRVAAAVLAGAGALTYVQDAIAQYVSLVVARQDPNTLTRVVTNEKGGLDFGTPLAEVPLDFTPLHTARNADDDIVVGCSYGVFTVHSDQDLSVKDIFEIQELGGLKVVAMDFAKDHSELAAFGGENEETYKDSLFVRHANGSIQLLPETSIYALKFDSKNNLLVLTGDELRRYKPENGKYVFDTSVSFPDKDGTPLYTSHNLMVKNGKIYIGYSDYVRILSEDNLTILKSLNDLSTEYDSPHFLALSGTGLTAVAGPITKFRIFDEATGDLIASLQCPQIPGQKLSTVRGFAGTPLATKFFIKLTDPSTGAQGICLVTRDPVTNQYSATTKGTFSIAESIVDDPDSDLDGVSDPPDNCKKVPNPQQETPADAGLTPSDPADAEKGLHCQEGPLTTADGTVLEKGYTSEDGTVNVWGIENLEESKITDGKTLLSADISDPTTVTVAKSDPNTKITLTSPSDLSVTIKNILEGTIIVTKGSDPANPVIMQQGDTSTFTDKDGVSVATEGTTFVAEYNAIESSEETKNPPDAADAIDGQSGDAVPVEDTSVDTAGNKDALSPDGEVKPRAVDASPEVDAAGKKDQVSPEPGAPDVASADNGPYLPPPYGPEKPACSPGKTSKTNPITSAATAFALTAALVLNRKPRKKES